MKKDGRMGGRNVEMGPGYLGECGEEQWGTKLSMLPSVSCEF